MTRVVTAHDFVTSGWANALVRSVSDHNLAASDFGAGRSDPLVVANFIPSVTIGSGSFVIAVCFANF